MPWSCFTCRVNGMIGEAIRFNGAISACVKGEQWEQAVVLLDKMRATGMAANVMSIITAISACEKGRQWEQALPLLHRMRETDMTADVMSFNVALSSRKKRRAVGASSSATLLHRCMRAV